MRDRDRRPRHVGGAVNRLVRQHRIIAAAQAGASPILDRTEFAPTEELAPGPNPLAIGYAWLKQQPAYVESKDA